MIRFATLLLLLAVAGTAVAATHDVMQAGMTFSPSEITIDVGDTVVWHHGSGIHTVTNGTGAADPDVGNLFDLTLSSGTVSHTFTSAGDVPYFCRPHESFGMTGLIHVQEEVASEAATWSAVKELWR